MFIRVSSEKELRRYGVAFPAQLANSLAERVTPALDHARSAASALEQVHKELPGAKEVNIGWAKRYPTYADPVSREVRRTVLLEGVTLTSAFDFLVQAAEPCLFYELRVIAAPRLPLVDEARRYIADFYAQALSRDLPNALPKPASLALGFYTIKVVERVTKPLRGAEGHRHV